MRIIIQRRRRSNYYRGEFFLLLIDGVAINVLFASRESLVDALQAINEGIA